MQIFQGLTWQTDRMILHQKLVILGGHLDFLFDQRQTVGRTYQMSGCSMCRLPLMSTLMTTHISTQSDHPKWVSQMTAGSDQPKWIPWMTTLNQGPRPPRLFCAVLYPTYLWFALFSVRSQVVPWAVSVAYPMDEAIRTNCGEYTRTHAAEHR